MTDNGTSESGKTKPLAELRQGWPGLDWAGCWAGLVWATQSFGKASAGLAWIGRAGCGLGWAEAHSKAGLG